MLRTATLNSLRIVTSRNKFRLPLRLPASRRSGNSARMRRAPWIGTANDSYFAAMTFPEGVSAAVQPSSLHDATWGVLSAVYGGAIHPTAEGHAAMADAALPAAASVLQLDADGARRAGA